MREFRIDRKAMYFTNDNYGVNVFWRDIFFGRGIRFYLSQLIKGIKCVI